MKYLIVPELDDLTASMTKMDLGDLIINGRIEAYSCKRAGNDKRTAKSLENHYKTLARSSPKLPSSPLGPLALPSTRKLLISLITTMNNSFPDYDFSELRPDQFTEKKVAAVISTLNELCLDSMDRGNSGFRTRFWKVLDDVIQTKESQVFTYDPGFGSSGTLWSNNYFFFNKNLKKIVFLLVSGHSKLAMASKEEEEEVVSDNDVEMDEMEIDDEVAPKKLISSKREDINYNLIDYEDLGLDSIDIPPSSWISDDFSSSSFSSSSIDFSTESKESFSSPISFNDPQSSQTSFTPNSRSIFSGSNTQNNRDSSNPFFVSNYNTRMSNDLASLFSTTTRG